MSHAAIDTDNLTKHYGRVHALESLTLRVEPGEIFGFLGPNGAGKTTTIRLLLGLIRPHRAARRCSVMTSLAAHRGGATSATFRATLNLWRSLSGARTLEMLADLTGRAPAWRDELLARLDLGGSDLDRPVGTYSDGMRQKVGIVQALQCAPKLVLLDEPSKGLDPLVQVAFYDILQEVARRGTTVFFSSHVLPEVERICHRVAMLRGGRLITVGDVDDLRRSLPRRVTIVFKDGAPAIDLAEFGRVLVQSGQRIELLIAVDRVQAVVNRLASVPLADLLIEPQRLEDAFLEQSPLMDRRIPTALLGRLWRQHRLALAIVAIGVAAFEFVISRVAPLPGEAGFLGGLVALLPPDVSSFINDQMPLATSRGVIALGYVHPFFLSLFSAWTIRVGVGALSGEIGRGTMDVLASRPIPRWALVGAAWLTIAIGLAIVAAAAWASTSIGLRLRPLGVTGTDVWQLPVMTWLLFVAWAGVALAISATRREAGPAIGWVSGLIATSFVIEFLTRVWKPIAWMRPLSLFTYYRPQDIVRTDFGWTDPLLLGVVAAAGLVVAVVAFERRDL